MIRRACPLFGILSITSGLAAAVGLSLAAPALAAQTSSGADAPETVSHPVVQAIPGVSGERLNAALERLARNPRDAEALADAGDAALGVGDSDAAIGFFERADAIRPGSARIAAGLASAYVRKRDPFTAIPLFERASRAGTLDPAQLADRGLAYDLVGDSALAQRYYHEALAAGRNDDATRRLALSEAIAGNRKAMEATLSPLLQQQDRAAWRTRAFALAILGHAVEAETIARSTLPTDLAEAMTGYLRYMPRLTAAQQAAAGDLGYFPRAADIGHDDPRVAQFAKGRSVLAAADQSLVPGGKPLGREHASPRPAAAQIVRDTAPPPEPKPARDDRPAAASVPPTPEPQRPVEPKLEAKPVSLAEVFAGFGKPSTAIAPRSGAVDLRKITPGSPPAPPEATLTKQQEVQPDCPRGARGKACRAKAAAAADKLDAAADCPKGTRGKACRARAAEAKADVVPDCPKGAKGKACRAKAAEAKAAADCAKHPRTKACKALAAKEKAQAEKDKAAKNPSRIWVQIESGRSESRLAFDWRKLVKNQPKLMRGHKAYSARYGSQLRMVTGPFPSEKAADAFVAKLAKAGIDDAHTWTSSDGSEVNPLGGK